MADPDRPNGAPPGQGMLFGAAAASGVGPTAAATAPTPAAPAMPSFSSFKPVGVVTAAAPPPGMPVLRPGLAGWWSG